MGNICSVGSNSSSSDYHFVKYRKGKNMKELTLEEAIEALKQGKKIKTKGDKTPFYLDKTGRFCYDSKEDGLHYVDFSGLCNCISDFEKILNGKHFLLVEEDILDKEEREYLGNIVRPFKRKYKGIRIEKCMIYKKSARIIIYFPMVDKDFDIIELPMFNTDNMYRGMEPNKQYTLKELGL